MNAARLPIIFTRVVAVTFASASASAAPPTPTPAAAPTPARADPSPARHLELGQPAPKFRIRALDGTLVRLDRMAYPGRERRFSPKRPVLIDFFRTDCQPCLDALPELVALHNKYNPRGLEIMMVALLEKDRGEEKLRAFLARHKLPFTVVQDITEHVAEKFMGKRTALPATFLVDRDGVLRKTKFSAKGSLEDHLDEALTAVMKQHAAAQAK